ncbi:MAG: ABC transporter ATP-binding protein [Halieaceae bacterium]|nr:ABC transporter ATP-binding protein [Halieaceae bacterium]
MKARLRSFFADFTELGASRGEIYRLATLTVAFALLEGAGLGLLLPIAGYATADTELPPGLATEFLHALGLSSASDRGTVLATMLLVAFVPFMLRGALQYVREISVARLKYRIIEQVTKNTLATTIRANFTYLHGQSIGVLQTYATVEAERAAEAMSGRMIFFTSLVLLLVYLALMLAISPQLTLFILPIFTIIALMFKYQRRLTSVLSAGISQQNQLLASQISDGLGGIQRVKMRGWEERVVARLFATVDRVLGHRMGIERLNIQMQIGMNPVLVVGAFLVVFVAIVQLGMGLESLGIYLLIMTRLGPQVMLMNAQWSNMYACMESYRQLEQQRDVAKSNREELTTGDPFTGIKEAIELENVGFGFGEGVAFKPVLKAVSCRFPRHSTSAIVGRSGAGKTTLVRLLTTLYRPSEGQICLDGKSLGDFSKVGLRRRMALVPQDPFLFSDSIRGNLCFGLEDEVAEDQLRDALEVAHCREFVERLPDGLDYQVGPRGGALSQGQRQRLAIAHALLTGPELLLLDEPTSALDTESEQAIQDTLLTLKGRLTIIIIAHRLGTIRHADNIMLLDHGRIQDQGEHSELLQRSSLYRTLFQLEPSTGEP